MSCVKYLITITSVKIINLKALINGEKYMQNSPSCHNALRLFCSSHDVLCSDLLLCCFLRRSELFTRSGVTVSSRSADVWRVPSGFIHSSQSLHISSLMHLCLYLCSRAEGNGAEGIRWKSHDACQEHVMVIFQLKIKNLYFA